MVCIVGDGVVEVVWFGVVVVWCVGYIVVVECCGVVGWLCDGCYC